MANTMRGGDWRKCVLPADQQTEAIAESTAQLWLSNPANKMQLPQVISAADADGDGTIDVDEFKALAAAAGANVDTRALFARLDKDGDGELDMAELQALLDTKRGKVKAAN